MPLVKLKQGKPTGKLFSSDRSEYEESFFCALKSGNTKKDFDLRIDVLFSVIFISKIFGLFPISGWSSEDPKDIKFQWKSFPTLFSICIVFASFSLSFLMLHRICQSGPLTPANIIGFIFFFSCAMACAFFFKLSMKFGELMDRWVKVEKSILKLNFSECSTSRWTLKKRVNVCLSCALTLALIEHLLSVSTQVQLVVLEFKVCNWTEKNIPHIFITKHLGFIFSFIEYNHFNGFLAEYLNFSCTFYWSFLDIFIMIMSIGISFNYERINSKIELLQERSLPDTVWAEIRLSYNEVSALLKFVDNIMDKMIILACCNDAYFVLIQLLNITM